MDHAAFFGIRAEQVSDAELLSALAFVSRDFDEYPEQMLCLLTPAGEEVSWFTFVASRWAPREAMAAHYFLDRFRDRLPAFVLAEHRDDCGVRWDFRYVERGQRGLFLRSSADEVLVLGGTLPPGLPRVESAFTIGLAALGWPSTPTWRTLDAPARIVWLRKDGSAPKRLAFEAWKKGAPRLPPVRVMTEHHEAPFAYFRDSALERFPLEHPPAVAQTGTRVGTTVRFDVSLQRPGEWPDLSAVERVTGRLHVISNYDPIGRWGLEVVDLGGVREIVSPGSLKVQGACVRVVGRVLERADMIEIWMAPSVELPRLRTLRCGTFGGGLLPESGFRTLSLPALEEVTSLDVTVTPPFELHLPALRSGRVQLRMEGDFTDVALGGCVLDLPLLPRENVVFDGALPDAELRRRLWPGEVRIVGTEIVLPDRVEFDMSGDIRPESARLLDQIAAVLRDHPDILAVEVQGYRHGWRRVPKVAMRDSQRYADAVVAALVERSVDARRLTATGCGAKRRLDGVVLRIAKRRPSPPARAKPSTEHR